MLYDKKFQNPLKCTCNNIVIFEIIPEVECDWGIHTIIQCPKCEELFSIDVKCPAFQNIIELLNHNMMLYTDKEQSDYLFKSHRL
tara:strand:- start:32 stop:286 length:255 start_codon:yes stop_codon:yes gene_type:complete